MISVIRRALHQRSARALFLSFGRSAISDLSASEIRRMRRARREGVGCRVRPDELFQFTRVLHGRVLDELSSFCEPPGEAEDSQASDAEADHFYRLRHSSGRCGRRLNWTRHGTAFGHGHPPREYANISEAQTGHCCAS